MTAAPPKPERGAARAMGWGVAIGMAFFVAMALFLRGCGWKWGGWE